MPREQNLEVMTERNVIFIRVVATEQTSAGGAGFRGGAKYCGPLSLFGPPPHYTPTANSRKEATRERKEK